MPRKLRANETNTYKARWEFANRRTTVTSIPANLQIARSNLCNFKCVYCCDHYPGNQVPRNKIDGESWKKMLALIPRAEMLAFHNISEFFTDPEFFKVVELCAASGAWLSLNTNGSVCTPRHLEALAKYPGQLTIAFSLDAATPETFLRIRGQDFWRILRNIKAYMDCFQERRDRTWVALSFVVNKSSLKDMMPFVFLGKALGVNIVVYYQLWEPEGCGWATESKAGGSFVYLDECVSRFPKEYNLELERTRKAAEILGIKVDLPAPIAEERPLAGVGRNDIPAVQQERAAL
jgi:molybdenum cofactor biosynthesis enzyme MoaA